MESDVKGRKNSLRRRYMITCPASPVITTDKCVGAGMRGIYPSNNTLAPVGIDRIRQAYANMIQLAELAGTDRFSAIRLVVYTTDMYRYRPLCNQAQTELWGDEPNKQPPRSIIEVQRLNDDDIVEVEGTFLVP